MRQEKTKKPIANFMLAESPLCDLMPFPNTEKAFRFFAMDLSDGEQVKEQFCIRFNKLEEKAEFEAKFNAAKEFNQKAKEGVSANELVWADEVEDIEEKMLDDMDNKMADNDEDDE